MLLFVTFLAISSAYDTRCILSFQLARKLKVPALIVLLGLSLLVLNFNIRKIENGLKWKQAHALSQSDPEKAFKIYSQIHDFMDHDRSFISNYGSIFYSLKKYDKLVEYYEKFGYLCTSSDILLMVGESYEKLENYAKAEAYYRKATNLIPHLFVPRYRLFKLYLRKGLVEKANLEAEKIRDLPIKVYSDAVKGIKTEVNEYLYNSSSGFIKK
jgi:tetratricopeptide (TPR) repeat protein